MIRLDQYLSDGVVGMVLGGAINSGTNIFWIIWEKNP